VSPLTPYCEANYPPLLAILPPKGQAGLVGTTALYLLVLLIPISIAVAVLRYHLYNVEVLINPTLVYASLTVVLALVYFGG
jgi:hypothetical protein